MKRLQVLSGQSAFQTVLQIIYALLIGGALALLALYCAWLALSLKKPSVPRTAEQSFN
ncbi:hypothetical protein J2Z22_003764 [Paenibacillus forsythiae]|uniref:ABC transporter permease n=1 Tax=Paenibacillus forsythiae TaxID=365616 RepID=A0ABU3HBG8_9BACL|nr:hypothetical protein [Paenibacillus forsythiae]MDT3428173.1 hypothetical protein [Paenibacillus forsythiae]